MSKFFNHLLINTTCTFKVRRNSRKLFQRNASDSNARLHHSTMLPVFPSDHGTEKESYFFFLNLYRTKEEFNSI